MAGLKLSIPGRFTDSTLPVLRDDAILAAGSLFLAEPAHPVKPWPSGVPVKGAAVPNIAKPSDLLGAGNHDGIYQVLGTPTATERFERTRKGGLHGMISAAGAGSAVMVQLPDSVMAYMEEKTPSNDFYLSVWGRITRPGTTTTARAYSSIARYNNGVSGFLLAQTPNNNRPSSGLQAGTRVENPNSNGPMYQSIGGKSNEKIVADIYQGGSRAVATWGSVNPWNAGGGAAGLMSWVFYRVYLEDLTVSKRTWAEVDALDYSLYSRHVLTTGGRYYGDTNATPSN